jgi:DNA-binding Lrp family transcriptional regulator
VTSDLGVDELDLSLLHALQTNPRAPWSLVAEVLAVDAATVARRWARMRDAGLAWLTAYPNDPTATVFAFIEVDCDGEHVPDVADALAEDPRVMTIEHVTGGRDLLLTVTTSSLHALSRFLSHDLQVEGVRACHTQLVNRLYIEGSRWGLRALDRAQQRRLTPPASARDRVTEAQVRGLLSALADDPRVSVSELAERMGRSRTTARRLLDAALAGRQIAIRCDLSRDVSGWPVSTTLWAFVSAELHRGAARALGAIPETRLTVGLTGGSANLLVSLWLRSLDDVQRLETELAGKLPEFRVVDRAVALHHFKRMGWLLDEHGRAVRQVPIDPWPRS